MRKAQIIPLSLIEEAVDTFVKSVSSTEDNDEIIANYKKLQTIIDTFDNEISVANFNFVTDCQDQENRVVVDHFNSVQPRILLLKKRALSALISSSNDSILKECLNAGFLETVITFVHFHNENSLELISKENNFIDEYGAILPRIPVFKKYYLDNSRNNREKAAVFSGMELRKYSSKISDIFLNLIAIRKQIAKRCEYDSYEKYIYASMGRVVFSPKDVKVLRDNIKCFIAPLLEKIKKCVSESNNISQIMYYDDELLATPVPCLKYKDQSLINKIGHIIYREDKAWGRLYFNMLRSGLIDYLPRRNKRSINLCASFQKEKISAISIMLSNSPADVFTIFHEFAHAISNDVMFSRNIFETMSGSDGTESIALIHEALCALNCKALFVNGDVGAYYLNNMLNRIVFAAMIDEFQSNIYSKTIQSINDVNSEYLFVEQQYRPYLSYKGIPEYEDGKRWMVVPHIIESPFYYIEYAIAGIMSLHFYFKYKEDKDNALTKFKGFIRDFGILSLRQIIKKYDLIDPFNGKSLAALSMEIAQCIT